MPDLAKWQNMELKFYLAILWRRKWVLILTVFITTIVAAIGSRRMVPQYSATAILWVPASTGSGVGSGDILLNDRLITTYSELATSPPVLAELEQRFDVKASEIQKSITVNSVAQTELLKVTVLDPDPQLAAALATSLAEIVIEQTQKTDAGRSLRVSLFAPAGIPYAPSWLGILSTPLWRQINIVLAFVISLVAGLGLVFLFEYLDTTLYTTKQIETTTGLTTLAQIPWARKSGQNRSLNGYTLPGEAFRYLRTNALFNHVGSRQTVLVTSAMPGEGKSTVVVNLALAIAQSQRKVVVVDANLHAPALNGIFNLPNKVGLSNLLGSGTTLSEALQNSDIPGIQVITTGPLSSNQAELLDSPHIATLVAQLKQQADFILIDTSAVMVATDAAVLSLLVDGVILVVQRAKAHQEAVQLARSQLGAVSNKLIGMVVNHR